MEFPMQRWPEQISPVESHLAYWLRYVGYRLCQELRQRARKFGVTAAEWVLLRKLCEYEHGEMPSRLAWRLGLSRGHVSRLAKRLEIKGLIHREKSLSDRRALILTLRAAGRAVIPYVAGAADETNARNFGGTGEAVNETLERVVKGIVHRDRFRFVPPERCRINRKLWYMAPDWDG
jgi:DNA-binding MarR family transcriptional regulator